FGFLMFLTIAVLLRRLVSWSIPTNTSGMAMVNRELQKISYTIQDGNRDCKINALRRMLRSVSKLLLDIRS
ncbi:MAG: hypothetical protein M1457_10160, partial [bacterium]|nr:hypothetical protein [bacterium]